MSAHERTAPGVPDRVAYIDGLRGIAALSVLAYHATHYFCKGLTPAHPAVFIFRLGTYGVDLFFVLSGFCLAYPFLRKGEAIDLVRFASRRVVRIVPPYYAAIAVLGLALLLGGAIPNVSDLITQALFLDRGGQFWSVTFWTLPVEIRWYFLFPLVLWLWTVSPRAFFVVGAAAIVAFQLTTAGALDLYALPAFMLGIVAADLALNHTVPKRTIACWSIGLLALALVLDWFVGPQRVYPPIAGADVRDAFPPLRILWQFTAFAFVLFAASSRTLRGLLSLRPLAFIGTASYSIYLIHVPVVQAVHVHLNQFGPIVESVLSAAFGIGAGVVFWRIFEYPLTETALKNVAIGTVQPYVARAFVWLRLPSVIPLQRRESFAIVRAPETTPATLESPPKVVATLN